MLRKATLFVLCCALLFAAGYTFAALTATKNVPSGATMITDVNLSVYNSLSTPIEVTFIDWQTMLPSQVRTFELWVQDDAEIPLYVSISTKNWVPSNASDTMTFTYTYGNNWEIAKYPTLQPHQRASFFLTLTAGENPPSGALSFTIVVSGTTV